MCRCLVVVLLLCLLLFSCANNRRCYPNQVQLNNYSCESHVFRTRIVIETAKVLVDGKLDTVFAIDEDDVFLHLDRTKQFWRELNIDFMVMSISHVKWEQRELTALWHDAARYPDYFTIIFALPRREMQFGGLGKVPWAVEPHGVLIINDYDEYILSHEFGHYLGLLHTFEEDFVDDTPFHKQHICHNVPLNIMSYCHSDNPVITPGQISRARYFLQHYRQDQIINPVPELNIMTVEELFGRPYGPEVCSFNE